MMIMAKSKLYPASNGFIPKTVPAVGGVILAEQDIEYNADRATATITIRNTGDRPIQVGSHFHLFEVNRYLEFDRSAAFGMHLNIPATTAVRFEPGDSREVEIVAYAGKRRVIGFNNLVDGYTGVEDAPIYYPVYRRALRRVHKQEFKCLCEDGAQKTSAQTQEGKKSNDKA
ncbi:MAG: urease subunit beta [Alistipes sp.]|nr:urease subunit beta [Alistipes sp.]